MKAKSLHYSKSGNVQVIAGRLGETYRCVSDQRPKDELVALMRRLVPTYREPEEVNREAIARMEEAAV